MPPVTIADTDSPGLQSVLEQMEKGREGGRKNAQTENAETPKSLLVTWSTNRGWGDKRKPKSVQRKVRLKLASGCMLMLGGMEG